MAVRIALAGDTMLGRKVAERLIADPSARLFGDEVVEATNDADVFVLNLECCISDRGEPWPDPAKPFFFRAPPRAVDVLTHLGVDAVTLANNHALDYGTPALLDTLDHLSAVGIAVVGAGEDLPRARRPALVDAGGLRLGLVGFADHPADFAADVGRPGIAHADLWEQAVPAWLTDTIASVDADLVVVTPHWGPNMTTVPVPHVVTAAPRLLTAGADVVAGHSAHVFHGVEARHEGVVLYDLGDFVDDYAVDQHRRNDLSLLWTLTVDDDGPVEVEALPLHLDYCFTHVAEADDADWIRRRLAAACEPHGTTVTERNGRLVIALR